jgi:hypothetical protein
MSDPETPSTKPATNDSAAPVAQADAPATSEATSEPAAPDAVALANAERDKLKEQLLRTLADFDNYRKRTQREKTDEYRRGKEDAGSLRSGDQVRESGKISSAIEPISPSVSMVTSLPMPAASIMTPMMLLALTRRSPLAIQTSHGKLPANLVNLADARA